MRPPRKLDVLLGAGGLLFGASSLAWPFGWNTSVHYYVGREWLLRGAIPYRDTFDHKPPLIHLVHAATIFLFGEGMWGIRLVELACVVVLGWACAALALGPRPTRDARAPAGLHGATILAASVLYYGFFDYWNTAQCELIGTTIAALMVLAAVRVRRPSRAAVVSGALAGAAIALKPPFVLFAALPIAMLWARASHDPRVPPWRARARVLATYALAAAAIPAAFVAYFAAHGALRQFGTILIACNLAYVRHEPRLHSAGEVARTLVIIWRTFCPVASLLLAASVVAVADATTRRAHARLRSWAHATAMLLLGLAVVGVQLKFYFYHWITLLSAVTWMTANVMVDASRWVRDRRRAWIPVTAAAALLAAYAGTGCQFDSWRGATAATIHWLRGDWSRARFASTFETWDHVRKYGDLEAAGLWLRDHSSPNDLVLVRGVAAEIYVVSGRRAPGRFFWTAFLTRDSRRFHREQWLAEDDAAFERSKPRWVVTYGPAQSGIDSESWFLPRGYVERARFGKNVILERRGDG